MNFLLSGKCRPLLLLMFTVPMLSSCVIFSNFQSAETVGKKQGEFTPFSSSIFGFGSGDGDYLQQNLGFNYAYGIDDQFDLRFQLGTMLTGEHPFDFSSFGDLNLVKLGPKFQLMDDPNHKMAVNFPVGKSFDGNFEFGDETIIEPTLLYTYAEAPLKPTVGVKWIGGIDSELDLVAINLGVHSPGPPIFRPELGFLFNPGEEGVIVQFGFGFSFPIKNE